MLRFISIVFSMLCFAAIGADTNAQARYPNKPIRIIIPYGPGGGTDTIVRIVAEHLRNSFGVPVIVVNKPGGSGILAIDETAHSAPDGYTVMVGNISTNGLTPLLLAKNMRVDYQKDIITIARMGDFQSLFISTNKSDFPPKSMTELIAYAKENPEKLMFASAGRGSIQHLDFELLMKRTGIKLRHIPYKGGGADMLKDMARGEPHLSIGGYAAQVSMINAGLIRPLALVGDNHIEELPGVQSMAEAGYPDVGSNQWQVMVAPARIPKEILDTLNKAVAEAMKAPEVLALFKKLHVLPPPPLTHDQTVAWMRDEFAKLKRITDELDFKIED